MQILHADDPTTLEATVAALAAGDVVVVPTDTVYGLAARAGDPAAVRRIFEAKARPDVVHLPIMAGSLEQVLGLGLDLPPPARALAARWWPGPLTLVLGFAPGAPRPPWLEGRHEVAVRIPDHPFLLALLQRTGALAVTSANRHGEATPSSAGAAGAALAGHVSLVIDGGALRSTPSTLVNARVDPPVVERAGAIDPADIAAVAAAS